MPPNFVGVTDIANFTFSPVFCYTSLLGAHSDPPIELLGLKFRCEGCGRHEASIMTNMGHQRHCPYVQYYSDYGGYMQFHHVSSWPGGGDGVGGGGGGQQGGTDLAGRLARASDHFLSLMEIWRDDALHQTLKTHLYRRSTLSVFAYGHEAWQLGSSTLRTISWFNARCLSVITGRSIGDEATDPTFDLCSHLRARRLIRLGHILRMGPAEPVHRVVTSHWVALRTGGLFMDAPEHASVSELTAIAADRAQWREYVNRLIDRGGGM